MIYWHGSFESNLVTMQSAVLSVAFTNRKERKRLDGLFRPS